MNGSLRSKGPGVWELVFDVGRDPLTNRRRQRSRTFRGTKREAERELRRLVRDVESGRVTGTATTVSDLLGSWLDMAADDLSPTTLREYRRLVAKRIGPAIGDVPLVKLTTPTLDEFYRALSREAGLSPASVRQVHSIVRRGLKQGVKWGWIEHNAAVNATPPTLRRREIKPPTMDAVRTIIREADAYDEMFGVLVRLAIATGMRRAELVGLRWTDLTLERRKLRVERSVVAVPDGTRAKTTKTGSTRRLSLDQPTVDLLTCHRRSMSKRAEEAGHALSPHAYVFSHDVEGVRPLHPDNVTSAFRRLPSCKGSVRFHDLRHAHATQLIAAGVDIPTVSKRLGHEQSSTTMNIYAHAVEENDEDAADLIGGLLEDPPQSPDDHL